MQHGTPFRFEFEFETFEKSSAAPGKERRIGGFVSTDDLDKQGEVLIQEGLDFNPFLKSGWFNDNHASATGKAVGYPEVAELRHLPDGRKAWYVEGYLLKGHPPADEIWSMATALERSGAPRRLGYSVEGSIVERDPSDPSTVRRAIVREVAITRCPVNDKTALTVLAKSLAAGHVQAPAPGAPQSGDGSPLRVESLEADDDKKKRRAKKRLTKSEAVALLCSLNPKLTPQAAETIVIHAMRHHAA